jgi:hypothetical protein
MFGTSQLPDASFDIPSDISVRPSARARSNIRQSATGNSGNWPFTMSRETVV